MKHPENHFTGWPKSIWERGGMRFLPIFGLLLRQPTGILMIQFSGLLTEEIFGHLLKVG
jgi:hypothetical protein